MKNKILRLNIFFSLILFILPFLIFYKNIKYEKVVLKENENISILIQDENGEYIESNNTNWPPSYYVINYDKSDCLNALNLEYDKLSSSIIFEGNTNVKCNIAFDKDSEAKTAYDLSGNNLNGNFIEDVDVRMDDEGNYGLYFGGLKGYVEIPVIPEDINWADGFEYEFEAKWLKFNNFSRIFDFGNGSSNDNIVLCTHGTSNSAYPSVFYGNNKYEIRSDAIKDLELNKRVKIHVSYKKTENGFLETTYKDGIKHREYLYETENLVRNIERTKNYLGRSNWNESFFNGYIYNLKITAANGDLILWYKFDS